jgi:xanthine/CO dehydrogenase XdhC/CoxF family maturation factor
MLFAPSGLRAGLISAGCLENDILERAQGVLEGGAPQLALYDLNSDLDLVWGTRMGCQGVADVLLEPVAPGHLPDWMAQASAMVEERRTGALATVFGTRGDTAGLGAGAHFLYDQDGPGLLPPGVPGELLRLELAAAVASSKAGARTLELPGGELDLLLEPILPPFALWIYGAGEHARPLARLAKELGWFVGILDHRPALATAERFPEADRIAVGRPPELMEGLPLDRRSAALVVSHIYDEDREALAAFLRAPLGYVGLQGNRARSRRLLKELAEEHGALDADQERILHWPAGLDIGAETPEAIALSMLAEIQAVLAGHGGAPLGERDGPIHRAGAAPGKDERGLKEI